MREEFFGDVHDFVKFGLLRQVVLAGGWSLVVAWMLRPSEGPAPPRRHRYLANPGRFRPCDPELFDTLQELVTRDGPLQAAEASGLLPGARFFADPVPDAAQARQRWFASLLEASRGAEVVFLDPDNGWEVPSCPYGRKNASGYVYFWEAAALFAHGYGLVAFQFLPRVILEPYLRQRLAQLRTAVPEAHLRVVSTARVAFFFAVPEPSAASLDSRLRAFSPRWGQVFPLTLW